MLASTKNTCEECFVNVCYKTFNNIAFCPMLRLARLMLSSSHCPDCVDPDPLAPAADKNPE
jgi:hypothetical protein